MRTYLRARVKGGTYFFTVNLAQRHASTLLIDHVQELKHAFRQVRRVYPFGMPAFVILPEHMHCIWKLPSDDDDFPTRWRLIKSAFSRSMPKSEQRTSSRQLKRERSIWQRRYWEQLVRDDEHFKNCLDYIHYNPVKHGYVDRAADWSHSSFGAWVGRGVYSADWGLGKGSG